MKKCLRILLLLALFTAVLCVAVIAADAPTVPGIYDIAVESGYSATVTFEAQLADGTAVAAETKLLEEADKPFYANAEKVKVTYNGTGSGFQLILALSEDDVPTETNIVYIDQDTMSGSEISFTVYPSSLENGKTYYVYLANSEGKNKILTFKYFLPYKLGDVDDDEYVTATDALWCLQNVADTRAFTSTQSKAGDVDHDEYITATDALWILQNVAALRTLE